MGESHRRFSQYEAFRCLALAWWLSVAIAAPGPQAAAQQTAVAAPSRTVTVRFPGAVDGVAPSHEVMRQWLAWLGDQGFNIDRCGLDASAGTFILESAAPSDLERLTAAGFSVVDMLDREPLEGGQRTQSQYFNPAEIQSMLIQIAADYPAITHLFSIGTTTQGRTIWAIEISDNPGVAEDEPAIQFNGQHHAREVATSHVVMNVIDFLTQGYGSDAEATDWVNRYKTVCVPMVNPDGVNHVFTSDSLWRKNRQSYPPSCLGVDLNRNYPYLWGPGCGSSGTCSSDVYRGPSSASELETQAMRGLADTYNFAMATSYHSYGRFIDYPYACSNGSPSQQMPEHAVIDEMMRGMAAGIRAVNGVIYSVYSPVPFGGVNGDDTSWYYAHKGTYPFIVEIGTSFEPPFSQVAGIVNENRGGWRYLYSRLGQARLDVHVTAGCEPVEAEVTLTNYAFDTGELPRETFLPFGRWTYVVKANGSYTVRASKPGYITAESTVAVANVPVAVAIDLAPATPPSFLLGDMDGNCLVDGADIDEFVAVSLGQPSGLPQQVLRADFAADCVIDQADLSGFVAALLAGDGCP